MPLRQWLAIIAVVSLAACEGVPRTNPGTMLEDAPATSALEEGRTAIGAGDYRELPLSFRAIRDFACGTLRQQSSGAGHVRDKAMH